MRSPTRVSTSTTCAVSVAHSAAADEWTRKAIKGLFPGGKESQEKTTLVGKIVARDEKDKTGKPITSAFLEQEDGSLIPLPCAPRKNEGKEVLQLLAEGRSMKEIAARLGITTRTVAFHKYRLMDKLAIRTTAELVQVAARHRLV